MPNYRELYQKIGSNQTFKPNDQVCMVAGACFRHNSKDLCNAETCPTYNDCAIKATFPICSPENCACGPLNLELIDEACRKRKMTAIKTRVVKRSRYLLYPNGLHTLVPKLV